jgi:hypothetical protein
MSKKVTETEFNRMVFAILIKYSMFLKIEPKEIEEKIKQFSKQLTTENEKSIQHSQDDVVTEKSI